MKKLLLLLLILCISVIANAQPFGEAVKNYRIKKQNYKNFSGEQGFTIFKYTGNNKLSRAIWRLTDESRYSNNYYEYDSSGNLVLSFREFSDGITTREYFIYDQSGNKVNEKFYRSDSISGSASYQYENNSLKTAILKNYKGWLTGVIEYQYNNENQRTKGIITRSGNIIGSIDYTYDSVGNLTRAHWDFNGKWSQTFTYEYEKVNSKKHYYSTPFLQGTDNFRIISENYNYNDEKKGPSNYFYNEDGLLFKKVFTRNDGVSTKTFYQYDNDRKLVASKRIYANGDTAKFTYGYNESNKLITRNCSMSDTLFSSESYLYNSDGELIKAYFYNFDNWLTGTLSFNSNIAGSIVSGEFKGQNGFDASIIFKYNSQGNLSKIKWDFTFGKFQEYTFEYESKNRE